MRLMIGTVLLAAALPAAAQMYRWTDSAGRTHYTDTLPPASATNVQKRQASAQTEASDSLPEPYALQLARKNAPVKLYSAPDCAECVEARKLLNARGVPFTEINVSDEPSLAELKSAAGGTMVPALIVGSSVQKGFEETLYHGMLDAAGYPKTGVLPPRVEQAQPEHEGQPRQSPARGPYAPRVN